LITKYFILALSREFTKSLTFLLLGEDLAFKQQLYRFSSFCPYTAKHMTEKQIVNKKDGTSGLAESKPLIKLQGTLTSQIQLRGEETKEPYYYAFIKLKGQSVDLPVIFKIKDELDQLFKPNLKKNDETELTGNYSNSPHSIRKSFTAHDYQLLNERRIRKKCSECGDGSGTIKFHQPPRNCKTCYLAKVKILDQAKNQLPKLEAEVEKIRQIRQQLESHE
jgi:hypothetical protein